MNCCSQSGSIATFFSAGAKRFRKRYEKKGFERSQKQLLEGLKKAGYAGGTILEIGCGVGSLHQHLLQEGAKSAVGIDLAPKMLEEARAISDSRKLSERTQYIEGDFLDLKSSVGSADVTLLDKVVCCYSDREGLVGASLEKTKHVLGLVYPRRTMLARTVSSLMAFGFWIVRSAFRNYIHDPEAIEAQIVKAGFQKTFQDHTPIWLSQVYVRVAAA